MCLNTNRGSKRDVVQLWKSDFKSGFKSNFPNLCLHNVNNFDGNQVKKLTLCRDGLGRFDLKSDFHN